MALSPRRAALNLWLRLIVKPRLAAVQDPIRIRRNFEREARFFVDPPGMVYRAERLAGGVAGVWAEPDGGGAERALLYLHGGAFICGSPRTHRHLAGWIARGAGAAALLPDYRLAPEHPYPAALDDAETAYRHLLARGFAPGRVALAGDSAGGGLAFALLLRLEAQGLPAPGAVVGLSPWADLTGEAAAIRRNAERDVMLPAERFVEAAALYLHGHDARDAEASPVFGRFRAPPPALILVSEDELLADDADALAAALRRAGGTVELEHWPGLPHAWPVFAGHLPEADAAVERAAAFLRQHLR